MLLRLAIYSDLHLEFAPWEPPSPLDVDAVLLAGDIHIGTMAINWARRVFKGLPVFYVAGNHEYYGQDWQDLPRQLDMAAAGSNITVLENRVAMLPIGRQGVRILGATLWTDFAMMGEPFQAMAAAPLFMNDYVQISNGGLPLNPERVKERHEQSRAWLTETLTSIDSGEPLIVVTHHAPTARSLPDYRKSHAAYYASDLDRLIIEHGPNLWVHGHTHAQCDYRLGPTRIVSNQRGYGGHSPNDLALNFASNLVVEIPLPI